MTNMLEHDEVREQVIDLETRITIFRSKSGKMWYIDYVDSQKNHVFLPVQADQDKGGIIPPEDMRQFKAEVCHGEPRIPIGIVQNTVNRLYHKALEDARKRSSVPRTTD